MTARPVEPSDELPPSDSPRGSPRNRLFDRRPWLAPLLLVVGLLVVYVPTVCQPDKTINDAVANSAVAWRIATTGTPWFDSIGPPSDRLAWFQFGTGADGHLVINRTPGQILLAVPFYLFSDSTTFSSFRGGIAAAFMTAVAMGLLYLATRPWLGAPTAMVGVIVVALTTPMWSVSADALWTHPATVLGICGAAYAASREHWWIAGAFLGVGIMARPHEALIAFALGVGVAMARRSLGPMIGVGVPSAIGLGLLSPWNRFLYGTWDIRGAYQGSKDYAQIIPGEQSGYFHNLVGWFFGWDYGWVWWTPLLFLMIPTLIRGWRHAPAWVRALAVGGLLYMFAQIGLSIYTGGRGFWGYRLALEPLACLAPLAFSSFRTSAGPWLRRSVPWLTAVQFAIIGFGAINAPLEVMSVTGYEWEPNPVYLLVRDYPLASVPVLLLFAVLWLLVWWSIARRWTSSLPSPA